ncbi:MAG: AmmeMemoRadiSam system radical SAM enzyme, partial [Planctomycetota bacterium]
AANVDPIEKKPLFHFLPGTKSLSIAAPGCNFQCEFCQNWQISQAPRDGRIEGEPVTPEQIVATAQRGRCPSISYTYTEPTVFFELAYETARLAHERGIRNVFVSNGFLTPKAVETIAPYLDAINVDLKAFRDETYRTVMKARLAPVLECLKALVAAKIWVEVTTLVVPKMNDSAAELRDIAAFIADQLGPHVPWHVSRFHGDFRMTDRPATSVSTLQTACRLAAEAGLQYVYSGNVTQDANENTHCPKCRALLIERVGFSIRANRLTKGKCPACGVAIAGVWE